MEVRLSPRWCEQQEQRSTWSDGVPPASPRSPFSRAPQPRSFSRNTNASSSTDGEALAPPRPLDKQLSASNLSTSSGGGARLSREASEAFVQLFGAVNAPIPTGFVRTREALLEGKRAAVDGQVTVSLETAESLHAALSGFVRLRSQARDAYCDLKQYVIKSEEAIRKLRRKNYRLLTQLEQEWSVRREQEHCLEVHARAESERARSAKGALLGAPGERNCLHESWASLNSLCGSEPARLAKAAGAEGGDGAPPQDAFAQRMAQLLSGGPPTRERLAQQAAALAEEATRLQRQLAEVDLARARIDDAARQLEAERRPGLGRWLSWRPSFRTPRTAVRDDDAVSVSNHSRAADRSGPLEEVPDAAGRSGELNSNTARSQSAGRASSAAPDSQSSNSPKSAVDDGVLAEDGDVAAVTQMLVEAKLQLASTQDETMRLKHALNKSAGATTVAETRAAELEAKLEDAVARAEAAEQAVRALGKLAVKAAPAAAAGRPGSADSGDHEGGAADGAAAPATPCESVRSGAGLSDSLRRASAELERAAASVSAPLPDVGAYADGGRSAARAASASAPSSARARGSAAFRGDGGAEICEAARDGTTAAAAVAQAAGIFKTAFEAALLESQSSQLLSVHSAEASSEALASTGPLPAP